MPPRLQRTLVILLVVAAALWAAAWWARGRPVVALAGAVAILLPHAPVLALEFLLLGLTRHGDPVPPARPRVLLAAWWHEVWAGVRVFGWQQAFAARAEPDHLPPAAAGRRGVVLVHGFVCNRGLWNPWLRRLRALGVPCIAVELRPVLATIERHAPTLDAAVERLRRATGVAPLVVAHSMGGLVVRAWLRERAVDAERACAGVVTIGTPHHGTWLARFAHAPNARQMRRGAPWLAALRGGEPHGRYRRFTCFHSDADNVVFPASTATLPGADNRLLHGMAHVQMLSHPAVFDAVVARLGEG